MTALGCDAIDRPGGFSITDRALALADFPPGARLLDIGCGRGATVWHLINTHALEAYGLDLDARAESHRNRSIRAPGENIPFAAGTLDGALLECSLSVMEDPDQVLAECHRILKPRGCLLLSDLYARGEAAQLKGCLVRVERQETLLAKVERHGFEVQQFEDFSRELVAHWGQKIFERGTAAFCAEVGADKAKLKAVNCGYCLIVARKAWL